MRRLVLVAVLVLPCAAAAQQKRPIRVDDFARIKNVGDPQLSPDGQWVAYTVNTTDLGRDRSDTDVWMVSWDGATTLRLTSTPESESQPRWSPDSRYISFVSGRQEGRGGQIWLLDRRGGEAQRLTQIQGGVSGYSWSPDSKRIVFTVTDVEADSATAARPKPIVIDRYRFKSDGVGYLNRRRTHVYVFDVAAKKLDSLTVGDFDDSDPEWSPDGKWIAFTSKREGEDPDRSNNTDIYLIEARKGAAARRLTSFEGADSGPTFSPDGKWIAYLQGDIAKWASYSQPKVALMPVEGGAPRFLATKLDRDIGGIQFSRDGQWLYALVTDDLRRYPARIHVADDRVERLAGGDRVVAGLSMNESGRMAVTMAQPQSPAEVYAFENGEYRQLTRHNQDFLNEVQLVSAEAGTFKSKDGVEVHGIVVKPLNYQPGTRVPTLFRIHGGPNSQDDFGFSFERQLYAANGYAVIAPNYRGSNGRGHAWKKAIHADWGNKEVIDVHAAVDWAVKSGLADAQRLGIGGWSYGCITTNYSIATDTRFAAATCGAGGGLWFSMYGSDQYIVQYEQELGLPWENPDRWLKLSYPFLKANRIKTPTLYLGGQNDFNVPVVGGEQMYQALKTLGVPTQLIIYPNERHGISRPSFVKDRYERYLDWYARYLKPKPAT
jgi:dipeptidyl aminopeptidase/acylaminoacyl peptidase